eukprot:tig00000076_g2460.t1
MSCTSRVEKRARVDEVAAAAAGDSPSAAQLAGAFDALPDAVASGVFKWLGPRAMWPLRGVCRRWWRVIEETEWPAFELRTDDKKPELKKSGAGSAAAPSRHDAATALVEKRKLRLSDGASVSLGAGWREVEAACGLLAALVSDGGRGGSGSGAAQAQPREVAFRSLRSKDGAEEDGYEYGEDFLSRFVLGALRALRPPAGAPSRLEGLHLAVYGTRNRIPRKKPPGEELRAALSPFGKLRSLTLYFNARDSGVTAEAAAAIVAACPLLRSLSFRPDFASESAALAALAPLAHLERLVLVLQREELDASGGGFGAIADGPAGRSLRTLFFLDDDEVGESDAFPRLAEVDAPRKGDSASARLSAAAVRALARLTRLERLEPMGFYFSNESLDAIRALVGVVSLRQLVLCSRGSDVGANKAFLGVLAETLSALPGLSRLCLSLHMENASPKDVAAFLSCAGARRSLVELDFILLRPPSKAEAEAVAALPALRRLFLCPALESTSSAALRPYEILARLGPDVAIEVYLTSSTLTNAEVEGPRAAIDALLAAGGRRPYP